MREFGNPGVLKGAFFGTSKKRIPAVSDLGDRLRVKIAGPKQKDEDGPAQKKPRGVSTRRTTLLTSGSAVGQDTQRRTLLGGG